MTGVAFASSSAVVTDAGLDGPLDEALDRLGSTRARAVLHELLEERRTGPELTRGGQLMSEGYPVELTFSTAAPGTVRYTADIVPPSCPPGWRLPRALGLLHRHGVTIPVSPVLEFLADEQAASVPSFGAWVGGRHDAAGDRYKLYVDVPTDRSASAQAGLSRLLGRGYRLLDTASLRFVGLELDTGAVELYVRVGRLDRRYLESLLGAEGLAHRAGDLLAAVSAALGRPVVDSIPLVNLCASVAIRPGAAATVSLFAHSVSLLGRDLACRRRLLALADEAGLDLGGYAAVSAGLAETPPARRHHSMLTLAVSECGPVHLGIGLRPPDRSPHRTSGPNRHLIPQRSRA